VYAGTYRFRNIFKPVTLQQTYQALVDLGNNLRAPKHHAGDKLNKARSQSDFPVRVLGGKHSAAAD
jgi:hypothetical protein